MDWSDLFIFVLGVFLLVAYTEIVKSIDNEIGFDTSAARSIQGIYTIGIIFIMNSIYSLAGYTAPKMGSNDDVRIAMQAFMIILGIVLVVLGAIILDKTKNMKDKKAKNWSIAIITGGSLMVALTIGKIGYGYYKDSHPTGAVKYVSNQEHVQLPAAHAAAAAPEHHFPKRHTFAFF